MKKLISLFLCLCLMAGIVPVVAESAAPDVKTPMQESLEKLDAVSSVEVIQPAEGWLAVSSDTSADANCTEKTVPVYRDSLTGNETVVLRMFGDIPYIKIDDYYNKLIFTGAEKYPQQASPMQVTRNGSVYETTAYDGTKGVFDAETDTFECENLDKYANPPYR